MKDKEEMVSYTLRVPKSLYERLKAISDKENRSIQKQIITLLEFAINTLFPS